MLFNKLSVEVRLVIWEEALSTEYINIYSMAEDWLGYGIYGNPRRVYGRIVDNEQKTDLPSLLQAAHECKSSTTIEGIKSVILRV